MHVRFPFWFRGTRPVLNVQYAKALKPMKREVVWGNYPKEDCGQAVAMLEFRFKWRAIWVDLWHGPCHVEAE